MNCFDEIKQLYKYSLEISRFKKRIRKDFFRVFKPGLTMLQWFFTNQCNYRCGYCNVPYSSKKDLGNEDRKEGLRIISDRFKPKIINITGGEPTLKLEELIEFICYSDKLGILPTLNTNASLLDENMIKDLAGTGLRYMSFSFDGVSPKDDIDVFEKAQYAMSKGILVSIQSVLSDQNWDKRQEITERCKTYGILFTPTIINSLGLDYSSDKVKPPKVSEVREFYKKMLSLRWLGHLKASTSYIKHISDAYGTMMHCRDFQWLTIDNDGVLKHCNEYPSNFSINDLEDEGKLQAFQEFRRKVSYNCPGCYYECYYNSSGSLIGKISIKDYLKTELVGRKMLFFKFIDLLSQD